MIRAALFAILLGSPAGCVSVRIESPCADSEVNMNLPHNIGVRTCTTAHDPVAPKDHPKKEAQ